MIPCCLDKSAGVIPRSPQRMACPPDDASRAVSGSRPIWHR
jgi:hypothetical protein